MRGRVFCGGSISLVGRFGGSFCGDGREMGLSLEGQMGGFVRDNEILWRVGTNGEVCARAAEGGFVCS